VERRETFDTALADSFRGSENRPYRRNEIVRLCLERGLYLQAAFFRRNSGDEPVVTDLAERVRAKQARLLAESAERLENELRYEEAEAAFNRSLSLYRELRNLDPVDPRYPEAIRELSEQRNTLREIRVAEHLLAAGIVRDGTAAGESKRELRILLSNTSGSPMEQAEVLVRFSGWGASLWQAVLGSIPAGGGVTLEISLSRGAAARMSQTGPTRLNTEDLHIPCNLLVRYEHNGEEAAEHFSLPVVFPAGTLRLPP
jgi:hypothetical protein